MSFVMLSWIIAGTMSGLVVGLLLGYRRPREAPPPVETAPQRDDAQQRLATERLRQSNQELISRLHDLTQRHERQLEAILKVHAIERATSEEDLRRTQDQLQRMIEMAERSNVISSNAFAPTTPVSLDEPAGRG